MDAVRRWAAALGSRLYAIPAVCVAGAMTLAVAAPRLDAVVDTGWLFPSGAESARSVLSTIAASMITLTGLVFSVTMLVLQLASAQYSPRMLGSFLDDRVSQLTLGVFTGTFVYAMLVLRNIGNDEEPGLPVVLGIALVLLSLAMFVAFVDHIAQRIRVSSVLLGVAARTRQTIERTYRELVDAPMTAEVAPPDVVLAAERGGVVAAVDRDRLARCATAQQIFVRVLARPGEFVPTGSPLLAVSGHPDDERGLLATVTLADERSIAHDVAYGLRQLVDVAERALSPGVNDPTTASEAVDQLHDLLRLLAVRRPPDELVVDDDGRPRAIVPSPDWSDLLDLAVDEVAHYGQDSVQVRRRLRLMLEDLLTVTSGTRREDVTTKLALLR